MSLTAPMWDAAERFAARLNKDSDFETVVRIAGSAALSVTTGNRITYFVVEDKTNGRGFRWE